MQARLFAFLFYILVVACPALADVVARLSTEKAYVGAPIVLYVEINDPAEDFVPKLPEIEGLKIEMGRPSQEIHRFNSVIRRRVSTYPFHLTPLREGDFEIPVLTINTNSGTHSTEPVKFTARISETGDLMFLELLGTEDHYYVGQTIDLTLKLWIKPFIETKTETFLSGNDMWRLLDQQNTDWGPFQETIEDMARRGRRPAHTVAWHKDGAGEEVKYYLYEIDEQLYRKKPGIVLENPIKVAMNYPVELRQLKNRMDPLMERFLGGDGTFGSRARWSVSAQRPISVSTSVDPIQVITVPSEGQPDDYRGAVGKFALSVRADPQTVAAGDSVTLNILIRGTGLMNSIQPPLLASLPELTKHFTVSDEPLAGVVWQQQPDLKSFSTTVRPRSESVTQIPPIPFHFYDPETKSYETTFSKPVSLSVTKAEKLDFNAIIGGSADAGPITKSLANDTNGKNSQFRSVTFGRENNKQLLSKWVWGILFAAPAVFLLYCLQRYRSGFRTSIRRRTVLAGIERTSDPSEISSNVSDYLSHRKEQSNHSIETEWDALAGDCEKASFGGAAEYSIQELKNRALGLVNRASLIPVSKDSKRRPTRQIIGVIRNVAFCVALTALAVFAVYPNLSDASDNGSRKLALTDSQQNLLLAEASQAYETGLIVAETSPLRSRELFRDAAVKLQMLVDSGVDDADLYFNLGNAYLRDQQVGRAIANFTRTKKYQPLDFSAHQNLILARQSLEKNSEISQPYFKWSQSWQILQRQTSFVFVVAVLLTCWIVFWTIWIVRISRGKGLLLSRLAVLGTILCCIWLLASNQKTHFKNFAVVVSEDAKVYAGSGESFDLSSVDLTLGSSVSILQRRAGWIRIKCPGGEIGWVRESDLESV